MEASDVERRILVCAVVGRDAELTVSLLRRAGLAAERGATVEALVREIERGAAAVVVAEEALGGAGLSALIAALGGQPAWSDVPILVVAGTDRSLLGGQRTSERARLLGNVTLLERPLRAISLVSAARNALRVRLRQYEMRALLAELEAGVRQRDQFLAMLGHELRNPLAAIVYATACLVDDPRQAKPRAIIDQQTRHLTRLVDDLLDVARITTGKVALARSVVDLRDIARRVVEAMGGNAPAIKIVLVVSPAPVMVDVDPMRIEQVAANLLANAIKYTAPGGHVRVGVDRRGERALLSVEDDGEGIASDVLPRIFDVFVQADRTLDRAAGGLGLGLSVVRGLVEQHGGAVRARSEGLGRGTRFEVELPALLEVPEDAPTQAPPADVESSPRRVLVVEDEADAREMLVLVLEEAGHAVQAAGTGPDAIAMAADVTPDVALIDVGLPEMDGYEVARTLRRNLGSGVYLAALTGYGQESDRERAHAAGFDAHLTKPVEIERVERLVASAPRYRGVG